MAIQLFPEPTTSASEDGFSYTLSTALKQYKLTQTFAPGIYRISTSPAYDVLVEFLLGDNTLVSTTTSSGTINFNLASSCSDTTITLLSGSDTIVTFDKIATSISGAELSGTIDTITSTSTYNQTGKLYVLAVGGGGGGSGSDNANYLSSGHGGGAGGHTVGYVYTNAPTSITIGSGGNGVARSENLVRHNIDANSGGATSFGNSITASGGTGGGAPRNGSAGQTGNIRTGGSGGGNDDTNGRGVEVVSNRKTIKDGSNAGGAGGKRDGGTAWASRGSGIGTGGSGGNTPSGDGNSGTGYGAGGGGGGFNGNVGGTGFSGGGNGTSGVVYVLRGF